MVRGNKWSLLKLCPAEQWYRNKKTDYEFPARSVDKATDDEFQVRSVDKETDDELQVRSVDKETGQSGILPR